MQGMSGFQRHSLISPERPNTPGPYVLSYRGLRTGIGVIGIALPFVLAIGKWFLESPGLLDSTSAYYYSVMRSVFVGSLWAVAVFLFSYRYGRADNIASKIACICALGISLFPAAPAHPTDQQQAIGIAHTVYAAGFYLTLAYFALFLFRKTYPGQIPTGRKRMRNTIYLICGLEMVFCLTLIVLLRFLPKPQWLLQLHPNFLFESLAVEAFGVAWFVKGGNVLKDKDDVVAALYEMAGSVQPLDDSTQAVHAPQKTVKISHVLLGLIPTLLLLASVPLLAAKVPWAIWGIAFLLALFAIWLKWLSTRQSHRLIVEVSLQAAQQEENA